MNKGPQDKDAALSAAYLRLTGSTQSEVAQAVGVDRTTIIRWEKGDTWPDLLAEASRRWLAGLEAKARMVLLNGMDPTLALKVLERRLPDLAPATQNLNLAGLNIPERMEVVLVDPEPDSDEEDG